MELVILGLILFLILSLIERLILDKLRVLRSQGVSPTVSKFTRTQIPASTLEKLEIVGKILNTKQVRSTYGEKFNHCD